MEAFTPSQILESLNLTGTIHGTSTGQQWMESSLTITSNSPINNLELGSVSITTNEQYDVVVTAASEAFKTLRSMPAPKEESSCANLEMPCAKRKQHLVP